ncbi:MAG: hypothetical protein FD123_3965 [Bacteroidetes bacterium]|nr:MAG: hypothetical protein FD123_3965 [Bacteroidota bacterium]
MLGQLSAQKVETETVKVNANLYDDTKLLYRNEISGGLIIHSNGFGANFRRGKHITGTRKGVFECEFVNYRHPKEVKTVNPSYDASKGFYYGKLNSFLILRPGFGYQNVIFSKPEKSGVEIRYVTFIGGSLGFAKPVYLKILQQTPIDHYYDLTIEKYDPAIHYTDNIFGRAPYLKGFDELKLYPGGYAKLGLTFEYGVHDDAVKAIETGVCVDVYPKVVPIMANQRNQQVFVSLYLHFLYGRKWF